MNEIQCMLLWFFMSIVEWITPYCTLANLHNKIYVVAFRLLELPA